MPRLWTTGEEKRLIQMLDAGHTFKEIANALGRTPDAVERRIYFLRKSGANIKAARKKRVYTMDDKQQMQSLYDNGYSLKDIAATFNTHACLIYNYITPNRRKK